LALVFDHLLWAAPDLDAGAEAFAAATGVTPTVGGSHPGFGTRNRLARLGPGVFFEVIAPDPAQDHAGTRAQKIAAMPRPGIITFAVQTDDLAAAQRAAEAAGLTIRPPVAMSRTRPDGVKLAWRILYLEHPVYGEAVPFVIDWQGSPHPSTTTPEGCRLESLTVLQPEPEPLAAIYAALGLRIPVERAPVPGFIAVLGTPKGRVTLTG
jgi:hypothetical protein